MASSTITGLVDGILENLQDGQNPWTLLRAALEQQVKPNFGDSFKSQLYANYALIGFDCLILCVCVYLRIRQQGTFWLVRVFRATGGTYIVVHYASAFLCLWIIFYGLLEGYIHSTALFASSVLETDTALWRTLVWLPGLLAFYCAAWSLVVSHLLHVDSSGRPLRSFFASAVFINAVGILLPIALVVAVAVLASYAEKYYRATMKGYQVIDILLASIEGTYDGTFDTSLFSSGVGLQIGTAFSNNLSDFGTFFRFTFVAYLVFSLLLALILCTSATLHLKELRRTMENLRNLSQVDDETVQQEKQLDESYRGLAQLTYAIVISLVAIVVLFLFISIAGRKVVYDEQIAKVASLLPLWLFSVIGLAVSSALFFRLLRSTSSPTARLPTSHPVSQHSHETVVPIGSAGESKAASVLDMKSEPASDSYPMSALSTASYQPRTPDGLHSFDSRRQDTPSQASQVGSEANLVGASVVSAAEQPPYASYHTRPAGGH